MEERFQNNFAKDLSMLAAVVAHSAEVTVSGSYSDRRPDLGKMATCPHCHRRRRVLGPRCCNPAFATTQRAWTPELGFHQAECAERATTSPFSKSFIRRFTHKRHGQNKQFKIRYQIFLFQHFPNLLEAAIREMNLWTKDEKGVSVLAIPRGEHVPAFAERYWFWKVEQTDRAMRKRTARSRQITQRSTK